MSQVGPMPPVVPIQIKPVSGQAKVSADAAPAPQAVSSQADQVVNTQVAEQRRYETVKRLAEGIANVFVVGDKRFTIFKDMSGQYVTRFTSLRDGRVTYIPEPELFRMQNSSQVTAPSINLNV